jgi:uncharacterized protein involved in response to NO
MPPTFFLDPVSWHAHEMVYGFCMAIVAGFLLTAVANWTGGAPVRQMQLMCLSGLWIAGRVAMGIDFGLPTWSIAAIELSFVPALALSLAIPLFRSWSKRNFVFLALLTALFACDAWFFLRGNIAALHVAMMMILMMVSLIGGRIIPAFTVASLRRRGIVAFQTDQSRLDMMALLSLLAVTFYLVFDKGMLLLGVVSAFSSIIHGLRMRHYHTPKTGGEPLLWILHAGYAWLVAGLALLALAGFGVFDIKTVIHALTAGCIGSMILGMICRVTLGHTGRDLRIGKLTTASFYAIQLAAVLRVFGPIFAPAYTSEWIVSSAILWTLCFAAYLVIYAGMLFSVRPDGEEA